MKEIMVYFSVSLFAGTLLAQSEKGIVLNHPSSDRGFSVLKSLRKRSSVTEWDTKMLSAQDLSDLLWAANGINRPEIGKRTAPSAMNAQDIDIYIVMKEASYVYNPKDHRLDWIVDGDLRALVADRQVEAARAPVICVLVSDISRFRSGEESLKMTWAAIDAGIVSQNIALFCASLDFATRPRATMNQQKLREVLKLKDSQHLILNNPVSYKIE